MAGALSLATSVPPQACAEETGTASPVAEPDFDFVRASIDAFERRAAKCGVSATELQKMRETVSGAMDPEASIEARRQLLCIMCMVDSAEGVHYVTRQEVFEHDPSGVKDDLSYISALYHQAALVAASTGHLKCLDALNSARGFSVEYDAVMMDIMRQAVASGQTNVCQYMVLQCVDDMAIGTVFAALQVDEHDFKNANSFRRFAGLPEWSLDEWRQQVAATAATIIERNDVASRMHIGLRTQMLLMMDDCTNPYLIKVLEPLTTKK